MNKTQPSQGNLIEPPVVIDFFQLFAESKLSENEIGILKRRLLENREPFGKLLQLLAKHIKQESGTPDLPESLKDLCSLIKHQFIHPVELGDLRNSLPEERHYEDP